MIVVITCIIETNIVIDFLWFIKKGGWEKHLPGFVFRFLKFHAKLRYKWQYLE